jgi:hypothetical protein
MTRCSISFERGAFFTSDVIPMFYSPVLGLLGRSIGLIEPDSLPVFSQ